MAQQDQTFLDKLKNAIRKNEGHRKHVMHHNGFVEKLVP